MKATLGLLALSSSMQARPTIDSYIITAAEKICNCNSIGTVKRHWERAALMGCVEVQL